jgi:hypothetical protein
MPTRIALPTRYELRHRSPNNLFLVEDYFNEVIIRATRDNFSPRQKLFFIRHLALEGYIPARYERLNELGETAQQRLTWVVDRSWLSQSDTIRCESGRFMCRLLFSGVLAWLVMMGVLFLGTR